MRLTYLFLAILLAGNLSAQVPFNDYFTKKSLRIDYYLSGDASQTVVSLAQLKKEPYWAGNHENLIDPFSYGKYKIIVYDKKTNKLIYSKGFCTLFQEWQTTAEARELNRSYYQVNTIPFPKMPVRLEIHMREKENRFSKIFEYSVDTGNYFILNEKQIECKVTKVH
ncbi:MAG: peptidase M64, partial [Bacteroidales bacterium]|nr:peptidase M64 [Bacteroidales bacterium]